MFALVDCNNFYASCEQVFRPKLARKPLVILSNNDGCVIARSQKAKERGIEMGAPVYQLKTEIERGEIQALSSNFTLYADFSNRVMSVLESYSPEMEIYSIDEAFFLLEPKDSSLLCQDAHAIRRKVLKWTGIPISIGIAPTKTLAKLANRMAKKQPGLDGVFALADPAQIRSALERTAPEDIWGIGRATSQKLKTNSIHSAAQLVDQNDQSIRKLLGVKGFRTVLELRAIPCIELADEEKRQSIVCSRSFPHPIDSLHLLEEALSSFVTRAAQKLRSQGSKARFFSVFLSGSPFKEPYESRSCHAQLPHPTAFTPQLISLAKQALAQIFRSGIPYKKAGVVLGDFVDEEISQGDLFSSDPVSEKRQAAMQTLDEINRRYDKPAVKFLAEGIEQPWKSRRSNVSPCYTTRWADLLSICS